MDLFSSDENVPEHCFGNLFGELINELLVFYPLPDVASI